MLFSPLSGDLWTRSLPECQVPRLNATGSVHRVQVIKSLWVAKMNTCTWTQTMAVSSVWQKRLKRLVRKEVSSLFKQRRRSWVSTVKWSQHCKVLAWETIEQRFSVFVQVRVEVCFSSSEELILATWCTLLSECAPSTQKGAWPTAHLKNVED